MDPAAFDEQRHADVWRLTAYAVETCLLDMQVKQMQLDSLGPLDLLIFNLIALASVQRTVRELIIGPDAQDFKPRDSDNGFISRRRVADATGLPRVTVGRVIERLKAKGFVVEGQSGRVQVPVGIVLQGPYACDPRDLYSPIVTMVKRLQRLGVIGKHDREG